MIAAGHQHSGIMDYTLAQFESYLASARKREAEVMRWQLVANALGFSGGEGLKKALKALKTT